MIKTFSHKGLKKFFVDGITSGIQEKHQKKLRLILGLINQAELIEEINFSGSNLHRLKGDKKEFWSITVSKNWRIIFEFKKGNAYSLDYH